MRLVPGEHEAFWGKAEGLVLTALKDYARFASGGQGLVRRLFAGDAAHEFALIDLCRLRFDVVLMNPPFGDGSKQALEILHREGVSPDQERPLRRLRRVWAETAPARRTPRHDHLANRVLPHLVQEVARGNPPPRSRADRLRRPRLRGARLGDGRDGGVLPGKMFVTTRGLRRLRDVHDHPSGSTSRPGGTRSPSRPRRGCDDHRKRPAGRPAHSRAHHPATPAPAPSTGDRGAKAGQYEGRLVVPDDFKEPLEEIREPMV